MRVGNRQKFGLDRCFCWVLLSVLRAGLIRLKQLKWKCWSFLKKTFELLIALTVVLWLHKLCTCVLYVFCCLICLVGSLTKNGFESFFCHLKNLEMTWGRFWSLGVEQNRKQTYRQHLSLLRIELWRTKVEIALKSLHLWG